MHAFQLAYALDHLFAVILNVFSQKLLDAKPFILSTNSAPGDQLLGNLPPLNTIAVSLEGNADLDLLLHSLTAALSLSRGRGGC